MTADDYFQNVAYPVKEVSLELRRIITEFSADLTEEVKWNVPTYSRNRNICSIMAHKKHVNFQIMQGAHIPKALELEGSGKDMRHVKICSLDDIDEAKLALYLKQAMELDK